MNKIQRPQMLNFTVKGSPTKGTNVGFCGNCGYTRQDTNGKPDTDCLCMAEMEHRLGCRYLAAISCLGSDRTPCTIYIDAAAAHDPSWGQT